MVGFCPSCEFGLLPLPKGEGWGGVRGSGRSIDPSPLTATLSPRGRGSAPRWRRDDLYAFDLDRGRHIVVRAWRAVGHVHRARLEVDEYGATLSARCASRPALVRKRRGSAKGIENRREKGRFWPPNEALSRMPGDASSPRAGFRKSPENLQKNSRHIEGFLQARHSCHG